MKFPEGHKKGLIKQNRLSVSRPCCHASRETTHDDDDHKKNGNSKAALLVQSSAAKKGDKTLKEKHEIILGQDSFSDEVVWSNLECSHHQDLRQKSSLIAGK